MQYDFYYYPLGEEGVNKFFGDIFKLLQAENIIRITENISGNAMNEIHPYLKELFKSNRGNKPVLILDNAHYISDPDDIKTMVNLSRKWQEITLILAGDTMDNDLLEDYHEFPLGPWGEQS
jgi:hypothetical protein